MSLGEHSFNVRLRRKPKYKSTNLHARKTHAKLFDTG